MSTIAEANAAWDRYCRLTDSNPIGEAKAWFIEGWLMRDDDEADS